MKKLIIPILFFCGVCLGQETQEEINIDTKNEIRFYTFGSYNTGSIGLEYERNIKETLSLAAFYRTGPDLHIEDNYHVENFGLGLKAIKYLNNYDSPSFWKFLFSNDTNILSKQFIELATVFSKYHQYQTERTIDGEGAFVIERKIEDQNTISMHAGIGTKYLLYKRVAIQLALGYEVPFSEDIAKNDFYVSFNIGYRF